MTLCNRGWRNHRDPPKFSNRLGKNTGAVNRFKDEMEFISNKHTQPRKQMRLPKVEEKGESNEE